MYHSTIRLRVIKKKKKVSHLDERRLVVGGGHAVVVEMQGVAQHGPALNQLTRVVKIDIYHTIRPFKRTPGKMLTESLELWKVFG